MRPIYQIVVHHSGSPHGTTVEEIALWHRENPKIGRLGYHLLILSDGTVEKGRLMEEVGAHARGHNLRSIGVCVIGDNTKPESRWNQAQIASLKALLEVLQIFWPAATLWGHRDLPGAATECPGLNLRALLVKGE